MTIVNSRRTSRVARPLVSATRVTVFWLHQNAEGVMVSRWQWVVVASFAIAACSSADAENGGSGGAPGDAGMDADAALSDASVADADCSAPASLEMSLQTLLGGKALAGASVRTIPCGSTLSTDSGGMVALPVAPGLAFTIAVEDPAIVPQVVGEWALSGPGNFRDSFLGVSEGQAIGASPTTALLVPRYWDSGMPVDLESISVSIKDHPEAQVAYFDASWNLLSGASATDSSGHFVVSGLGEGFVQVLAEKPGATVYAGAKNTELQTTGRVPVMNGFVSHIIVAVVPSSDGGPPPPADGGPQPPPAPGGAVLCGAKACTLPSEQCCAPASGGPGATCQPTGSACNEITVQCDEAGDCQSGEVCCGSSALGSAAKCTAASDCVTDASTGPFVFCDSSTTCPTSHPTCSPAPWGYWVCL